MGKGLKHINDTMNDSVATQTYVATIKEAISKLGITDGLTYLKADPYIGNPDRLLGEIYLVRSKNGETPTSLTDENASYEKYALPIQGIKIDEKSKLKEPLLRNSIIIDKKLSTSVSFLSYLAVELGGSDYFSLMVYDQSAGLIDMQDDSWKKGYLQWKADNQDIINDDSVYCIFAVTGYSQKNVIRKKYIKYDGKIKGGYFGVNINGELSTSTDEYSLDILFGLQPAIIKPFNRPTTKSSKNTKSLKTEQEEAEKTLRELLTALNGVKLSTLIK